MVGESDYCSGNSGALGSASVVVVLVVVAVAVEIHVVFAMVVAMVVAEAMAHMWNSRIILAFMDAPHNSWRI